MCTHLENVTYRPAKSYECEDCIKIGASWVHLRACEACGHVGCCDSSNNKHATKHFHTTSHPVIISAEPLERWAWCYEDEEFKELG